MVKSSFIGVQLHNFDFNSAAYVFTLFVSFIFQQGAITGQVLGTVFQSWVAISSLVYGQPPEKNSFSPTTTDMCVDSSSINYTGTTVSETFLTTPATTEIVQTTSER